MLQRIGNSWRVTWRRVFNVSGRSCKLLEADVPTCQEHLASYLKKMLRRIRNISQVTWRRCYNVSGTSCKWLGGDVTNISRTSCKLLDEDATPYQEHLASYFKKMLQRILNVLQVTWRRCYDVAGTSCLCVHRNMNVITPPHLTGNWSWKNSAVPVSAGQQERWWGCCACVCTGTWTLLPHPTPPVTDHERIVQCLCLQDSKKDDEVAVPVSAQEHERYYPTPPHR